MSERDIQLQLYAEGILEDMIWQLVENDLNFDDRFALRLAAIPLLKATHHEVERVMTAVFGDVDGDGTYRFEIDVSVDL